MQTRFHAGRFVLAAGLVAAAGCEMQAEDDSSQVGEVAVAQTIAAAAGAADAEEEGRLEAIVYEDSQSGRSRTEYFLRTAAGKRIKVVFGTAPRLQPGRQVRIRGQRSGDVLLVETAEESSTERLASSESASVALVAPGPKRMAIVMVKYDDDPSEPHTQDEMRDIVFTGSTSLNVYYQETSRTQVSLTGIRRSDGDVFGWMSVPRNLGSCETSASSADAQLLASGIDVNEYDHIMYVMPGLTDICGNSGFAQIFGKRSWIVWAGHTLMAHELGHNFGAWHANAWVCKEAGRIPVSMDVAGDCLSDEYDDPFDIMGIGYRHTSTYNKIHFGWLPVGNQATWTADGEFTIAPQEGAATGIQSLRIPRRPGTDWPTDTYYLEFRRPFGVIDTFASTDPVVNGISIRLGTAIPQSLNTQLVDTVPETSVTPDGWNDAPLTAGRAYYDPIDKLAFYTKTVTATNATVRVLGGRSAIRVNFQPTTAPVPAGYLKDDGSVFGNRGNGFSYGWNIDNRANARDRNSAETPNQDQRYDTLNHMQRPGGATTWEIAVPNGLYWARIGAGDTFIDTVYKIAAEGVVTLAATPTTAEKWFQRVAVVNVQDGRLTVTNASGSTNNKINFIELVPLNLANTLVSANFNSNTNSFTYADNTFRGTTQGNYANGTRITSGGVGNSAALQVKLAAVDGIAINNMSGGWRRTFSLTTSQFVSVTFSYALNMSFYEPDEYSEVLASLNNTLVAGEGADYVTRLSGAGDATPVSTGWRTVTLGLGLLPAGTHTLTLGGFNNKKTASNETSDIRFDDVFVRTF